MATVFDSAEYLGLITSEHRGKPKFLESVRASVVPFTDIQTTVWNLVEDFDLDGAIGKQLDAVGTRVGVSRTINLFTPDKWFSWDIIDLGWNEAPWFAGDIGDGATQDLTDDQYRVLIKARIIANKWDGTVTNAYEAYDLLFHYFNCEVLIQSYGHMKMLVLLMCNDVLDPLQMGLFYGKYLPLRPNGVQLFYATQSVVYHSVFAWDVDNENLQGWDDGAWSLIRELPQSEGIR